MTIPQIRMSMDAFNNPIPGDKLEYDDVFSMSVILDEEFKAYQQVHDWMWSMRSPIDLSTHLYVKDCYSDATVSVLGNNQQIIGRYNFVDCFPVSLPGPTHKTTSSEDEPMLVQISFAFTRFKYEKAGYPVLPV